MFLLLLSVFMLFLRKYYLSMLLFLMNIMLVSPSPLIEVQNGDLSKYFCIHIVVILLRKHEFKKRFNNHIVWTRHLLIIFY